MLLSDAKADFEWWCNDQVGYLAEMDRQAKENKKFSARCDAAFAEYMGPEFANVPLPTKDDLQNRVKERASRVTRLVELKAPETILQVEQRLLEEVMSDFRNGKYALTDAEIAYSKEYWDKADKFEYKDDKE